MKDQSEKGKEQGNRTEGDAAEERHGHLWDGQREGRGKQLLTVEWTHTVDGELRFPCEKGPDLVLWGKKVQKSTE